MKKHMALLALLLALCLMTAGLAEENPFDAPDPGQEAAAPSAQSGSITIDIGGAPVSLAFDPSRQYSSVIGGSVRASFYAYSDNSDYLYELFMYFPETVQAGSVIDQQDALRNDPECSVALVISTDEEERYYFAGEIDGSVYPRGSSFTIRFDTVENVSGGIAYSGRLSASLGQLEFDGTESLATFTIQDAAFSFTFPSENTGDSGENPFDNPSDDEGDTYDDYNPFDEVIPTPAPTQQTYRV